MKKLNERDIIKLMREEWNARVRSVLESISVDLSKDSELVTQGLKVRHKNSKLLYTVVSVSPNDIVLTTPENNEILIDKDEFEKEYVID